MSVVLLDGNGTRVAAAGGQHNHSATLDDADLILPITAEGQTTGTLLVRASGMGMGMGSNGAGEQFLAEVNEAILWAGIAAVLLALFLGLFLAHRLTRPLRQLTHATHLMAEGDLQQQVHVTTQDELGELAKSFNQMAAALPSTAPLVTAQPSPSPCPCNKYKKQDPDEPLCSSEFDI